MRKLLPVRCGRLMPPVLLCVLAVSAQPAQLRSASLHGTVRDASGASVSDAAVVLKNKHSGENTTTTTDATGNYTFTGLSAGEYSLHAAKSGSGEADAATIIIAEKGADAADLVLKSSSAGAPQFFDQPQFTVSGVVDTTALGGHGSDTIVRTRDSIAKDTATLSSSEINPTGVSPDVEKSLRAADYAKAADQVRRQIASDDEPRLHHLLAEINEKLGNSVDAVNEYERAAQMQSSEPYLFDWGSELLLHHASEPAEEVFTRGHKLFPQSERMLLGLGSSAFARGSYELAVQQICAASDLKPDDPVPYKFLAKMLQAENNPSAKLVDTLHRFATLQPENAEALYDYAAALWKQNRSIHNRAVTSNAESLLTNAIRLNPNFALPELQLGAMKAEQGEFFTAIAHYRRAIEIDPQLLEAHYRLSHAYRQTKQPDKAQQELQTYQQLSQQSAREIDRERHEIRQFVYTLRDQPPRQTR